MEMVVLLEGSPLPKISGSLTEWPVGIWPPSRVKPFSPGGSFSNDSQLKLSLDDSGSPPLWEDVGLLKGHIFSWTGICHSKLGEIN